MLNTTQLNKLTTTPYEWNNNVVYNEHKYFVLKLIELVSWNKVLQLN